MQPLTSVDQVEKPTADDLDKTFRTRFISIWLLGNAGIIIGIMQSSIAFRTWVIIPLSNHFLTSKFAPYNWVSLYFYLWKCYRRYFQALLWITFGLSFVRFLGFAWYLVSTCFLMLNHAQSVRFICMANLPFHSSPVNRPEPASSEWPVCAPDVAENWHSFGHTYITGFKQYFFSSSFPLQLYWLLMLKSVKINHVRVVMERRTLMLANN